MHSVSTERNLAEGAPHLLREPVERCRGENSVLKLSSIHPRRLKEVTPADGERRPREHTAWPSSQLRRQSPSITMTCGSKLL